MKSFLLLLSMLIVVLCSFSYFKLNNKVFHNELIERIIFFNGFDGFPVFSPSGKHLVFASNRNQKKRGDTNLFLAEWNYQ